MNSRPWHFIKIPFILWNRSSLRLYNATFINELLHFFLTVTPISNYSHHFVLGISFCSPTGSGQIVESINSSVSIIIVIFLEITGIVISVLMMKCYLFTFSVKKQDVSNISKCFSALFRITICAVVLFQVISFLKFAVPNTASINIFK